MNPLARIALNVFGPPIVASLFYSAITVFSGEIGLLDTPAMFLAVLVYASFYAAFPSIVHATLMEITYTRLCAGKLAATIVSSASGFLAGAVVVVLLNRGGGNAWIGSVLHPIERIFPALGLTTGLTLGLTIKVLSGKRPARETSFT
jgi:hypothetical protein